MTRARVALYTLLFVVPLLAAGPAGADGNEAPGAPVAFRSISAGSTFTCAVLADAGVACWGNNAAGQLGQGNAASRGDGPGEMGASLAVVDLGTGRSALSVAAGNAHACALLDNGTVKCWGNNSEGQLGLGNTAARGDGANEMGDNLPAADLGTGRTATAVTTTGNSSCALLDNGTVKCWGSNNGGLLGLGDTAARGDNANEMGDNLNAVALGTNRTATAVALGSSHVCALLDNGTVKCWGFGGSGRLGYGDTQSRGDNAGELGDSLPAVALGAGRTATAISGGNAHTCALLDNATVKCWGANAVGQLGTGDVAERGAIPGQMGDTMPAVSLGTSRTPVSVSVGGDFTCVVLDDASVKCWGKNLNGQLGTGDANNRGDNAGEMGDSLPIIPLGTGHVAGAATTGGSHACALLEDATLRCWGLNTSGQLGLGDTGSRGDGPGEMGDSLPATDPGASIGPSPAVDVHVVEAQLGAFVGQELAYTVTVTNTGGVPLSGVAVTDTDVPACAATIGALGVRGTTSYPCSRTATADDVGSVQHTLSVDTDQTDAVEAFANAVTVDLVRPDGRIRVGNGAVVGNGTYNLSGVGQGRSTTVGAGGTARFTVTLQNDGSAIDDLRLTGFGSTNRYVVTYKAGATNITAAVTGAGHVFNSVPAGGLRTVTVTVKARAGTPRGSAITRKLTVVSGLLDVRDAVKLTVTRR